MSARARRTAIIATVAAGVAVAACSSGANTPAEETITIPSSTTPGRVDDGILQVGVLLPASGEGATIGQAARAAIRIAVDRANASGGVLGVDVELFVRDEGADENTAALSIQQLIESHVDVIIGPASSIAAITVVPTAVQAGVALCSPSASALALDDLPDDGLFFRTIPSDSLQADAMAAMIEQTGQTSAAIAYVDDGYGRPFEAALQQSLRTRGIVVTKSVGFAIDDNDFTTEADRLVSSGGGALALIGDPDAGSRMLAALAAALDDTPRPIFVNDALRRPWSVSLLDSVKARTREMIRGVSNRVRSQSDDLLSAIAAEDGSARSGLFANQAYDCANLFMLAAQQTGSTQPRVIAAVVPDISSGGSPCATFVDCAALIAQERNIDYDSPGGVLDIGASGDPTSALFAEFTFDATGRDVSLDASVMGSG